MRQDAAEAVFSYAAANGLDLPRVSPGREGIWRDVLISEILLPEPEHVSDEMIDLLTAEECCRYNALNRGKDALGRLFNAALPAVDAEMKKTTGKGILETYGEKRTDPVVLFSMRGRRSGLTPYFYDRDCTVTYTAPNDHLETFLVAMARYCEQAIVKETKGSKGPVAGNIFTKEHRRMVDGIFNHGDIIEPQHRPKTGRGSVRGFCIGDADCPMVIDSTGFSDEAPPSNFLSSMVKYVAKGPSKGALTSARASRSRATAACRRTLWTITSGGENAPGKENTALLTRATCGCTSASSSTPMKTASTSWDSWRGWRGRTTDTSA